MTKKGRGRAWTRAEDATLIRERAKDPPTSWHFCGEILERSAQACKARVRLQARLRAAIEFKRSKK